MSNMITSAIRYNWQREIAYLANFTIANIGSLFYTITNLVFLNILYANVDNVGGYERDEMLLLYMLVQLSFYTFQAIFQQVIINLANGIHRGVLDYVLLRPRSALSILVAEGVSLMNLVRTYPLVMIIAIAIDWGSLSISIGQWAAGLVICMIGSVLFFLLQFILACTGFWLGNSWRIVVASYSTQSQTIPYTAASRIVRILIYYMLPTMVGGGLSASVMLGYTGIWSGLLIAVALLVVFMVISRLIWNRGLRVYTSASS